MQKRLSLKTFAAIVLLMAASGGAMAQDFAGIGINFERGRLRTICRHPGIKRVRTYDITSPDIPFSFNGYRIAFVADTHYPSLFTDETLTSLHDVLCELNADLLLLGGDYQENCEHVSPLFEKIMESSPKDGALAVLGNNDIERCTDIIKQEMSAYGIKLIEDTCVKVFKNGEYISVAGVHNFFSGRETAESPTLREPDSDFVILMTHTPDYAEDQDISHADLTLAGHTHGGQVTMMGAWAPVTASRYGQRFLKGLNWNSAGQPVITTTGIGTSRRDVRLFAPSEVILITLHSIRKFPKSVGLAIEDSASRKAEITPIKTAPIKEAAGQDNLPMPGRL